MKRIFSILLLSVLSLHAAADEAIDITQLTDRQKQGLLLESIFGVLQSYQYNPRQNHIITLDVLKDEKAYFKNLYSIIQTTNNNQKKERTEAYAQLHAKIVTDNIKIATNAAKSYGGDRNQIIWSSCVSASERYYLDCLVTVLETDHEEQQKIRQNIENIEKLHQLQRIHNISQPTEDEFAETFHQTITSLGDIRKDHSRCVKKTSALQNLLQTIEPDKSLDKKQITELTEQCITTEIKIFNKCRAGIEHKLEATLF